MPALLIVHHTPSPARQEMYEAAASGARTDEVEGVEVTVRPALTAGAADVLAAGAADVLAADACGHAGLGLVHLGRSG